MKFYETIFILDSAPDTIEAEIQKVTDLITANKGEVVIVDRWGMRKMAYEIKRRAQGYYTCIYFKGAEKIPETLENHYKLNESCLRYLTVVSIHSPEEIAARAEKAAKEAPAAATPVAAAPAAVATAAAPPAEEIKAEPAKAEEESSTQEEPAPGAESQEPPAEERSEEPEAGKEAADKEPSPTSEAQDNQEEEAKEEQPEAEEDKDKVS